MVETSLMQDALVMSAANLLSHRGVTSLVQDTLMMMSAVKLLSHRGLANLSATTT